MLEQQLDRIARRLLNKESGQTVTCLILGGTDTGKTTVVEELAKCLVGSEPVAIIDADIGQSHIGPPGTVGWTVVDKRRVDLSQLAAGGISFVGDVTPMRHLLQLTAGIVQSFRAASKLAGIIIIDTPGFITGQAAAALWWTVQKILQPQLILALQRNQELRDILCGLEGFSSQLELIKPSDRIPVKSPQQRQSYRQKQFSKYFGQSRLYDISLSRVAVQTGSNLNYSSPANRLVGLQNSKGSDVAIGIITRWQADKGVVVVRAPLIDIDQIRCIVIGDASVEISGQ